MLDLFSVLFLDVVTVEKLGALAHRLARRWVWGQSVSERGDNKLAASRPGSMVCRPERQIRSCALDCHVDANQLAPLMKCADTLLSV